MAEVTFVGVQNVAGKPCKVMHDGDVMLFELNEIRVVPAHVGRHLLSRAAYTSRAVEVAGEEKRYLERKSLFKSIPLNEALKHVKAPENKSLAAAKAEAEKAEKLEAELTERIMSRMRKDGWRAPEPQSQKGKL